MITDAQRAGLLPSPWLQNDPRTLARVEAMHREEEAHRMLGSGGRAARGLVRERANAELWIGIRATAAEAGVRYHEY